MKRLSPADRVAVIRAYLDGDKTEVIAAEFGVTSKYAYQLAKRRGHPCRPPGRPKSKRKQVTEITCVVVAVM